MLANREVNMLLLLASNIWAKYNKQIIKPGLVFCRDNLFYIVSELVYHNLDMKVQG